MYVIVILLERKGMIINFKKSAKMFLVKLCKSLKFIYNFLATKALLQKMNPQFKNQFILKNIKISIFILILILLLQILMKENLLCVKSYIYFKILIFLFQPHKTYCEILSPILTTLSECARSNSTIRKFLKLRVSILFLILLYFLSLVLQYMMHI